jgi:hypothetical protein
MVENVRNLQWDFQTVASQRRVFSLFPCLMGRSKTFLSFEAREKTSNKQIENRNDLEPQRTRWLSPTNQETRKKKKRKKYRKEKMIEKNK